MQIIISDQPRPANMSSTIRMIIIHVTARPVWRALKVVFVLVLKDSKLGLGPVNTIDLNDDPMCARMPRKGRRIFLDFVHFTG